jgi:hypothetical protein
MTLVILIVAAIISLVLGIATEVNSFSLFYVFFPIPYVLSFADYFVIYA